MRFDTTPTVLREPLVRALLVVLLAISGISLAQMVWSLVSQVSDLILLFVFSWVISFLLEPVVAGMSRVAWLPRSVSILLVYATLLFTVAASSILLFPLLVTQSETAAQQFPELDRTVRGWVTGFSAAMQTRGVSVGDYTGQLVRPLESVGPWLVANAVAVAAATASILAQVILALVLSLYFMFDGERLGRQFVVAFPRRYRDDVTYFIVSTNRAFGGFLRGQIIQSLVYAVGIALVMVGTGLPFAALTSVLAGFSIFIPFVGPLLGTAVPIIIALTADPGRAWLVAILAIALNIVVVNVVAPKVMSQQIGLSPIMVLVAVLVGARLGGPWGALFGIPVAAVIATMVSFYQLTVSERERHVEQMTSSADEDLSTPPEAGPIPAALAEG